MKALIKIQSSLKAHKGQYNNFGKYKYRNLEDILEAVKPLLLENKCSLIISDTIELIGTRFYVKATAKLFNEAGTVVAENTAYARESETKKGMDESQITGASSSYARKYALNGLFAIDDTKDADSNDNSQQNNQRQAPQQRPSQPVQQKPMPYPNDKFEQNKAAWIASIKEGKNTVQSIAARLASVGQFLTDQQASQIK